MWLHRLTQVNNVSHDLTMLDLTFNFAACVLKPMGSERRETASHAVADDNRKRVLPHSSAHVFIDSIWYIRQMLCDSDIFVSAMYRKFSWLLLILLGLGLGKGVHGTAPCGQMRIIGRISFICFSSTLGKRKSSHARSPSQQ